MKFLRNRLFRKNLFSLQISVMSSIHRWWRRDSPRIGDREVDDPGER